MQPIHPGKGQSLSKVTVCFLKSFAVIFVHKLGAIACDRQPKMQFAKYKANITKMDMVRPQIFRRVFPKIFAVIFVQKWGAIDSQNAILETEGLHTKIDIVRPLIFRRVFPKNICVYFRAKMGCDRQPKMKLSK